MQQETKICQNCKQQFVIDASDFVFYKKMAVPAPTFCWLCRAQRRLAFRNERYLYRRKSDFSGKEILSRLPSESPVKVYENEIWESDRWDAIEYAKEVDFSRPFLTQLLELIHEIPWRNRSTVGGVNSEYSNNFTELKNCYLIFNATLDEDCLYGNGVSYSKDCVDNSHIVRSEFCYESFWLTSCSYTFFSSQCSDSFNLYFCKNCVGCQDCFGCVNLRNQRYHIFNKPYTKEEYQKKLKEWDLGSFNLINELTHRSREFWLQFPNKFIEGIKNTQVSGQYIYNSKNVLNSYLVREGEDLKYCQYLQDKPARDSYDHTIWGNGTELIYESQQVGDGAYNLKFCVESWVNVKNLEYCVECQTLSDCFGCVSLRNKKYCILNKQYSKAEYETLREKIKKHMDVMPYKDKMGRIYRYGEFFPIAFSPFPYNQTIAQDHFPLAKNQALTQGWAWKDSEEKDYQPTISWKNIPDSIEAVKDDILNELILCKSWDENSQKALEHNCTKVYRLIPQEIAFYRKFKLPLPRNCPYSRTYERLRQRNSLRTWNRRCQCAGKTSQNSLYKNTVEHSHKNEHCPNTFETSYSPERKEIVYCAQCYLDEVA